MAVNDHLNIVFRSPKRRRHGNQFLLVVSTELMGVDGRRRPASGSAGHASVGLCPASSYVLLFVCFLVHVNHTEHKRKWWRSYFKKNNTVKFNSFWTILGKILRKFDINNKDLGAKSPPKPKLIKHQKERLRTRKSYLASQMQPSACCNCFDGWKNAKSPFALNDFVQHSKWRRVY